MTNLTTRIAALETTVARIDGALDRLLVHLEGPAPVVTPTVAPVESGVSFQELRMALRAHKAAGAIPAGVTVKEAIAQGLMTESGTLPGAAPAKAPKKGKKAKAAKSAKVAAVESGVSFMDLRNALKAHKASGAVKPGTTVKEALAAGLIDENGNLAVEAPKPAKRAKVAAKVDADAPAKVRAADGPRNALGHITPQSEWDLRERLALTGKFDRHEIDAIVAAQV